MFGDIIKLVIMFNKTNFKDSIKVKRTRNFTSKFQSVSVFFDIVN